MRHPFAILIALGTAWTAPAESQTLQYRSPAGVGYVSLTDTGAVARAESLLAADPRNVERILQLGLAQSAIRQYREAVATFSRGIALDSTNALLYRWRGHRHLSIRELARARADLERCLALDSMNYGGLYHLGIVQYVSGDFAAAAELFARALPRAPDGGERAGSIDWRWMSLARAGRHAEARAFLEGVADSLPVDNAYVRRLAVYRGAVSPDRVVTPADTADVQLATLSYGIGNWYLVQGDTTRARDWFERAIQSGGWPAFGFIAAEAELRRPR